MSKAIEKKENTNEKTKVGKAEEKLEELDLTTDESERKVKRLDSETLTLNGDKYQIIEDYREALDLELLEERYSEFLEKYDYIVGDIAYDKLRLRGFYDDKNKKVPIDMRISSLEDYLVEYCSFGCKYFVLKSLEPKKKQHEKSISKKKKQHNQKNHKNNKKQKNLKKFEQAKSRKEKNKKNKNDFVKKERKKESSKENTNKTKTKETQENNVKTVKDQEGQTKFHIRNNKE